MIELLHDVVDIKLLKNHDYVELLVLKYKFGTKVHRYYDKSIFILKFSNVSGVQSTPILKL